MANRGRAKTEAMLQSFCLRRPTMGWEIPEIQEWSLGRAGLGRDFRWVECHRSHPPMPPFSPGGIGEKAVIPGDLEVGTSMFWPTDPYCWQSDSCGGAGLVNAVTSTPNCVGSSCWGPLDKERRQQKSVRPQGPADPSSSLAEAVRTIISWHTGPFTLC